jgi:hypothetical protein
MPIVSKSLELPRDPQRKSVDAEADIELEALIVRFEPAVRRAVRRLVYSSYRVADLAIVFPGALYALASRRGPATQRRKALALIEQGALLKDVARAFERELGSVPSSDMFARRILNHLPRVTSESRLWLGSVLFGAKACDEYYALWLADQPIYHSSGEPQSLLGILSAYAWFSNTTGTRANELIVSPWRPEMSFDTALCAAKSWLNRIRLVLQLKPGAITDSWLEPQEVDGLSFTPLLEHAQILAEAQAMHNCADQYSERLARERCRLFSVRRKGQRVATLEVGPHPREAAMLTVTQLKARHNMPASSEVWQTAYRWLALQRDLKRQPLLIPPERLLDSEVWQELMLPYRIARRGAPWLPETLTTSAFVHLEGNLSELARRGGVSSWLFT